jgi:alpha-L-fucosidase 2
MMRIQGSEPKSVNIKVSLGTNHPGMEFTNVHNRLGIRGQLQSNNMTLEAMVAVKTEGTTGVSMSNSRQVVAMSFDSATLYYTMGTGWTANAYPTFDDKDPHERLVGAVDKAVAAWYNDQYLKHLKDYQVLFQSFQINLGDPVENKLPTNDLIDASRRGKAGKEETYLELLLLQYSRYLLIASSRPGSLPLSGRTVWNADVRLTDDSPRYMRK